MREKAYEVLGTGLETWELLSKYSCNYCEGWGHSALVPDLLELQPTPHCHSPLPQVPKGLVGGWDWGKLAAFGGRSCSSRLWGLMHLIGVGGDSSRSRNQGSPLGITSVMSFGLQSLACADLEGKGPESMVKPPSLSQQLQN